MRTATTSPQLFDPPYSEPQGNYDGSLGAHIVDFTAIDDVGHVAGAAQTNDGSVHGFVMTPYFPLQAGTAASILSQGLGSNDPFRTMAERSLIGLIAGSSETGCYQMNELRKTLSVTSGTHFTPAQRSAAQDALGAVLKTGECRTRSRSLRRRCRTSSRAKANACSSACNSSGAGGSTSSSEAPARAKIVALNVPKKKVKGTVRITLVARQLLDGGATPATVTVR